MADERAVSPVVAVALLIAISVLLATAIGAVVLNLDMGSAEAPSVTLSFEVVGDDVELHHEGGDALAADAVVVLDQNGAQLSPGLDDDLTTGESATIVTNLAGVERIRVVWRHPENSASEILATFEP